MPQEPKTRRAQPASMGMTCAWDGLDADRHDEEAEVEDPEDRAGDAKHDEGVAIRLEVTAEVEEVHQADLK